MNKRINLETAQRSGNCLRSQTVIHVNKKERLNNYSVSFKSRNKLRISGIFPFVPHSLVGAYYLQPQDTCAIFLLDDLLCIGTRSVMGAHKVVGGDTNGKDPKKFMRNKLN